MVGWAVVEGDDERGEVEVLFEDASHGVGDAEVGGGAVGEDAFVGARAFIMPGVTVGAGSIVGAMSVVTKDVPPQVTVAGNPIRVIRDTGVACASAGDAR